MQRVIKTYRIILFAIFCFACSQGNAQFSNNLGIGVNGGVFIYQGDLTPNWFGSFKTIHPGFSVFADKPISRFLSVRVQAAASKLSGDDSLHSVPAYRRHRNFTFSTAVSEFSVQLVWNILGRNYNGHGFMPYVFSGVAVTLINVKKDYSRVDLSIYPYGSSLWDGLAIDNAKGTPRSLFTVPAGFGAYLPLSKKFLLNAETSYRFIFTDYLDGFSKSADPKQQDHYQSISAGVIYKFGKKDNRLGCPVVKL